VLTQGLLSMANTGPDTNTAHFSIMMAPAPHLDGKYVIFGELVAGWDVAVAVNGLAKGVRTAGAEAGAVIIDAGQLR
jgi:peptidyl-prolyl isomerase D